MDWLKEYDLAMKNVDKMFNNYVSLTLEDQIPEDNHEADLIQAL